MVITLRWSIRRNTQKPKDNLPYASAQIFRLSSGIVRATKASLRCYNMLPPSHATPAVQPRRAINNNYPKLLNKRARQQGINEPVIIPLCAASDKSSLSISLPPSFLRIHIILVHVYYAHHLIVRCPKQIPPRVRNELFSRNDNDRIARFSNNYSQLSCRHTFLNLIGKRWSAIATRLFYFIWL